MMKEKPFKLTIKIERMLLPYFELEEQLKARQISILNRDEDIKKTQQVVDEAKAILSKHGNESEDVDVLAEKIVQKENEIAYMMLEDEKVAELNRKIKELMFDDEFYKPLLVHCFDVTEKEIEDMEAHEIEEHIVFFLFSMRPKRINSMNYSKDSKTNAQTSQSTDHIESS